MHITETISDIKGFKRYKTRFCRSLSIAFIFAIPILLNLVAEPVSAQTLHQATPFGGSFENASSVDVTPTGDFYITDQNRHRFVVINREGVRIDSVGNQGSGNYQFDRPVSIDATNGLKIYVADRNNRRLQIYDRRKQFLSKIDFTQIHGRGSFRPENVTVNRLGELFIFNSDRFRIHKFDTNGTYEMSFSLSDQRIRHFGGFTTSGNQLIILDRSGGMIHRYTFDGIYEGFLGGFSNSVAVRWFGDNLWSLENGRLIRMDRRGEPLSEIHFDQALLPHDFVIHRGTAFLLTRTGLFKLQQPS